MHINKITYFSILKVLIVLLLLSAFRNLTSLYYLLAFVLLFFVSLSALKTPIKINPLNAILFLFIGYTIFLIFWSAIYMQSWLFLPGIPRVLLMPMLTFFMLALIKNDDHLGTV